MDGLLPETKDKSSDADRQGVLSRFKIPLGWLWPVTGFLAVCVLSWLINVTSGHWAKKIERRVAENAGAASVFGQVVVKGRDVELHGTVPNEEVRGELEAAARKTDGVRTVTSKLEIAPVGSENPQTRRLPERPVFPPTVSAYAGADRRPVISGTWPHESGGKLEVELAGKSYRHGENRALEVKGDRFALRPADELSDGTYDVTVRVIAGGRIHSNKTRNEVMIDASPPEPPTVGVKVGLDLTPTVRGSWDRKDATKLEVSIAGRDFTLGESPSLVSDKEGNWTLSLQQKLIPGIYDVTVVTTDRFGNASKDVSENELVIGNVADTVPMLPVAEGAVRPVAAGKWAEGTGQTLEVVLNGETYRLGRDEELTSDGSGNWSLAPGLGINDGVYNITVRSVDETGGDRIFATTRKIVIDNSSPLPPKIEPYMGYSSPAHIYGTWDEKEAANLVVIVAGKRLALGNDEELRSTGFGRWIVDLQTPLAAGVYDVSVLTSDETGNLSRDQTRDEIVIKSPEKAQSPPWYAILEEGHVELRGTMPENVAPQRLFDHAAASFPKLSISDSAVRGILEEGDDWYKVAALALDQLRRLNSGSVRVEGKVVHVTGDAKDEASILRVERDLEIKLPKGFSSQISLTKDAGPSREECQARFDEALDGRKVRFADTTADFAPSSIGLLDRLANIALSCRRHLIEISGHTDSSGPFNANLKLSRQRALEVLKHFARKHPESLSLTSVGFGETRPVASNKTRAGRYRNKRIEIRVLP
ncbi:MAG: Ig-like domain-containing protein [Hyphomicrobiales bacterium]